MGDFWFFARGLGRQPGLLAASLVMALISAMSLGTGIVALLPALRNLFDPNNPESDISDILGGLNDKIWGFIPPAWIESLPSGTFNAVIFVFAFISVLTLVGGVATFLHSYFSLTIVQRAILEIRRTAFEHVVRLPLTAVIREGATDKASRIVHDASTLEAGFAALLSRAISQVLKGLAAVTAAFIVEPRVSLVTLVLAPVLYAVIRVLGRRVRRASKRALEEQAGLYGSTMESLQGLRVVKVYTTEEFEAQRFDRINREVMRHMLKVRTARALSSPLVEVLSILVLSGVFLVVAYYVIDGKIDLDKSFVALGALFTAGASLKPLSGLVNDIQSSAGAAQRLRELVESPAEAGSRERLPDLPPHSREITFDHVTYRYPGSEQAALRDVSLTVKVGETIAIVGPNGSGKTTLLGLVPRLFDPESGAVRVDGVDIRERSITSLRRQIGMVTQETIIFRGTIEYNIRYGSPGATREQVMEAARRARAHEFIEQMSGGYEAVVGDQGLTLSGGQRQRIAIARAILRDPRILILDEATSMIDADSEARIGEAMAEFTAGRTCLIVAHRLSTVARADRIVVMNEGRIVDEGRHAELMERCETYRLIARTQLGFEG